MSVILPGIIFTAETKPVDDFLPRMDIAAFVGFASSGPINIPVSIEDVEEFETIFGPELPLLWDPEKGQMQTSHLGPAVRAFFQTGGQRCWIVRVADDNAKVQWFQIPGMGGVALTHGKINCPLPSYIVARSPGSWADTVTVRTLLRRESHGFAISPLSQTTDSATYKITIARHADRPLRSCDLLQLRYQSIDVSSANYLIGYLPIRSEPENEDDTTTTVEGTPFVCLRICKKGYLPSHIRLLDETDPDLKTEHWVAVEDKTDYLSAQETRPLRLAYKNPTKLALPQKGVVLPVKWDLTSSPPQEQFGFIVVQNVITRDEEGSNDVTLEAQEDKIWELVDADTIINDYQPCPYVERVNFSLIAEHPDLGQKSIHNLGFLYNNPRAWLKLDPDDQRFGAPDEADAGKRKVNDLSAEAMQRNFPLAAPDITVDEDDVSPQEDNQEIDDSYIWFPLEMSESLFNIIDTHAAGDTDPETALIRDGVQHGNRLDKLFLDERLSQTSAVTLESQAIHYRYVQDKKRHKPLNGIHSLFFIEEITLLSAPDAVHRGWSKGIPPTDGIPVTSLPPPTIKSVSMDDDARTIQVSWEFNGGDSVEFFFQHTSDPPCLNIIEEHKIRKSYIDIPYLEGCEPHHYFRVRALSGSRASPWSNTAYFNAQDGFLGCGDIILPAPIVTIPEKNGTQLFLLTWDDLGQDVNYQIQESFDPLFRSTKVFNAGDATQYEIRPHHIKIRYYRIRATHVHSEYTATNEGNKRDSVFSPWSNTVRLLPLQKSEWRLHPIEDYRHDSMLNIHSAMLRMARSRGDLVSILSLPEHFQSQHTIEYKNRLISKARQGDIKLLSYGAIYHPWPMGLQHEAKPLTVPPDGVACGVIAQRSIRRGAWVAPANIVVQDVVALTQTFNRDETARLFEEQINLLSSDSRGFIVFNAVTLGVDEELKPLNVRRLLILLRRLALREGMETTFDPNDESTRRLIERIFERTLTDLYTRGAFSGDTPDKAFRVIVNESNNTRQSKDQGRLIIDLKVAPSQPLKFLTIRLIQGDGETGRVVEI